MDIDNLCRKFKLQKILSKGGKIVSEVKPEKLKLLKDKKSDKKLITKKTANKNIKKEIKK